MRGGTAWRADRFSRCEGNEWIQKKMNDVQRANGGSVHRAQHNNQSVDFSTDQAVEGAAIAGAAAIQNWSPSGTVCGLNNRAGTRDGRISGD